MKHKFEITFILKNFKIDREDAASLEDARTKVVHRLKTDPECCANIIITEFDPAKPGKGWVSLEEWAVRNGHVIQVR